MLADVVELEIAVGVGPEPALGAVKAGAVIGAGGKVPEGDRHRLPIDPLPVERVKLVPLSAQPVLTIGIPPVSPPELPGEKSLQGRIGLIHQRAAPILAEVKRLLEVLGLLPVEYVALAIVGGCAARFLVPEGGTALDRECLVSVDKGLTDGKGDTRRALEVNRDEGARHGRVAREEERSALLNDPGEPVADGVHPQVWPVVPHSNHDGCLPAFCCKKELVSVCGEKSLTTGKLACGGGWWQSKKLCQSIPSLTTLTAATLAKVDPDQLHHVGLQQVDVPPRRLLHLCEGAGGEVEKGGGASIHCLLWDSSFSHTRLHGRLACCHVQHWEKRVKAFLTKISVTQSRRFHFH